MDKESEFPFDRARQVTAQENKEFRAAISEQFGVELKKRDHPLKYEEEEYELISIRLHFLLALFLWLAFF